MCPSNSGLVALGLVTDTPNATDQYHWPVEICLFGGFRFLRAGELILSRTTGKVEALLSSLALDTKHGVRREALLSQLWPDSEPALAGQSLNTLIYSVRRLVARQLADNPPILIDAGTYRLNLGAGISVDVLRFEQLAADGDLDFQCGNSRRAAQHYASAVDLYRGDLCALGVPSLATERERLRARHLTLLARLANLHFQEGDTSACLKFAQALLHDDPCREDAVRLVMRSYVRLGERAQALRQFRLSEALLRTEFDAAPEPATVALWDEVRLHPERV